MATTPPERQAGHGGHDHPHGPGHHHDHATLHGAALALRQEVALPPSTEGSVLLDVGDGVGAVVLYTPAELLGAELDIHVAGHDEPLTHTAVRERHLDHGTVCAAVYPGLPAGEYVIPGRAPLPTTTVTVHSGTVTEIHP